MKLHCEICALFDPFTGEYRIGEHTEIADVNIQKLNLPIEASMFESLDTKRGLPPPWMNGAEWNSMKCPRGGHNIFVMWDERAQNAMTDGGPSSILTDEGWVKTKKDVEKNGEQDRDDQIFKMHLSGTPNKKIARVFDISKSRVSQILKKEKNAKKDESA